MLNELNNLLSKFELHIGNSYAWSREWQRLENQKNIRNSYHILFFFYITETRKCFQIIFELDNKLSDIIYSIYFVIYAKHKCCVIIHQSCFHINPSSCLKITDSIIVTALWYNLWHFSITKWWIGKNICCIKWTAIHIPGCEYVLGFMTKWFVLVKEQRSECDTRSV